MIRGKNIVITYKRIFKMDFILWKGFHFGTPLFDKMRNIINTNCHFFSSEKVDYFIIMNIDRRNGTELLI
jgi:hypothetical protein